MRTFIGIYMIFVFLNFGMFQGFKTVTRKELEGGVVVEICASLTGPILFGMIVGGAYGKQFPSKKE